MPKASHLYSNIGPNTKKACKYTICRLLTFFDIDFCGGEGNRTPVQTYSSNAFYMLIPLLIVGKKQEADKPIFSVAGWS